MDIRKAFLAMIQGVPGWLGRNGRNPWHEPRRHGEPHLRTQRAISPEVETALQMQSFSSTTHFAEAVAQVSGGVFMRLPEQSVQDRDELLAKFNELYGDLGDLSIKFKASVEDGEIDKRERADLSDVGQHIHRTVEELLTLTFQIYCRPASRK